MLKNALDIKIFPQVVSLGLAIAGETELAKEHQERFLKNSLEPLADGLPVVGHVKGIVHSAMGDHEKAAQVYEGEDPMDEKKIKIHYWYVYQ